MKVVVSPIKEYAKAHNIPVLQPVSLKDEKIVHEIANIKSDLFVVIAYGQFLPKKLINIPSNGAINVHGSFLPKYRGAAPINWAIINGERETGISIIRINHAMDAGDICAQTKIPISDDDTSVTLREQMMRIGPMLLLTTIDAIASGQCSFKEQDHACATFAPKLTKELGIIDWSKKADEICHLVRGLLPWPGARTYYNGKLLKILEADIIEEDFTSSDIGSVIRISKNGITVAAGEMGILIRKVHLQNGKPMDAYSFVVGRKIEVRFKFGN
jgi:methionyl-tRNA formyltransferase